MKLRTPVEFDGKTYTSIELREPKGSDLLLMDKYSGPEGRTQGLAAQLAGVPIEVVEEMHAADVRRLGDLTNKLLDSEADATGQLRQPVTVDGHDYTSIELREPKGRDLLVMDKLEGAVARTQALAAQLAEVPVEVFREMHGADALRFGELVGRLLGNDETPTGG